MADAKGIRCAGTGLQNGFAEGPNKFTIFSSPSHDVTKLQIGFSGLCQPQCKLVTKKDSSVDVTYWAGVAGEYKIHVLYEEIPVTGSPYKCKIIGDVKLAVTKVKVTGAIKEAAVNQDNNIIIDGREVGILGGLKGSMEGPSKPEFEFKPNTDGTVFLVYNPSVAGTYKIQLKFQHYNMPGSPYEVIVT